MEHAIFGGMVQQIVFGGMVHAIFAKNIFAILSREGAVLLRLHSPPHSTVFSCSPALPGAGKGKVKSAMARSVSEDNLLPQNVGSIINYLHYVITELAKWGTPSCSRPQPATDNGVRDGRSN